MFNETAFDTEPLYFIALLLASFRNFAVYIELRALGGGAQALVGVYTF